MRRCILSDSGTLATPSTTHDSHHLAIILGTLKKLCKLLIDACANEAPALSGGSNLLADIVPHPLGDGIPVAIKDLAYGSRAHPLKGVSCLVLTSLS